jgi:hypothetical protein
MEAKTFDDFCSNEDCKSDENSTCCKLAYEAATKASENSLNNEIDFLKEIIILLDGNCNHEKSPCIATKKMLNDRLAKLRA